MTSQEPFREATVCDIEGHIMEEVGTEDCLREQGYKYDQVRVSCTRCNYSDLESRRCTHKEVK